MDSNFTFEKDKKFIFKKILESTNNPLLNIRNLFKEELYGKKIEKRIINISKNKNNFNNFLKKFKFKVKNINDTILISNFLVETLREFSFNKYIFVSPRKSGTHLISKVFGCNFYSLPFNGKLNICSNEPGYYSLGNTFHTSFNKFFYNLDRENFDGGKLLPINNFIGILTARHPADIFYSHVNFSFSDNNTSFANLEFKSQKEKLDFIINSNAYEDFFKGLYDFTSWSRLNNFITLPFESLIELNQNYTDTKNLSILDTLNKIDLLINEEDLKHIFNKSPTFFNGKVGLGVDFVKKNCEQIFQNKYYKKYCDFYGYSYHNSCRPKNIEKINNKKIVLNDQRPLDTPITITPNYMNYTIFYYNKSLYAKPKNNNYDLEKLKNDENLYLKSYSCDEVKFKILSNRLNV